MFAAKTQGETLYASDGAGKAGPIFAGALVSALGLVLSLTASIAGSFTLATGCSLVGVRLFKPLIA